jgi:hypothetical protein
MNMKMSPFWMIAVIIIPVLFITIGLNQIGNADYQELNNFTSTGAFVFAGACIGVAYFFWGEMGMQENNRSYVANPLTDILAFVGSGFITIRAIQVDESLIAFIGSAIYTIHIMQLIFKNGIDWS